jgi:Kef-type K+ transport system membrane component KefB
MIATFGGCFVMWLLLFGVLVLLGNPLSESFIMGAAFMFSSTILAIKLLPTTTLHQKRMGGICIAILIAQDIIAVIMIMIVGLDGEGSLWRFIPMLAGKAVLFVMLVMLVEQYALRRMMKSVEMFNEVLLMLCLGWCLGISVLAEHIGLSYEIGAFVAGVAMARWKLSLIFSEQLKPLRDFFLMFFFFVLGAEFDVRLVKTVWIQALFLATLIVAIRPLCLSWFLRMSGEKPEFAKEIGARLGPASEFALIIAVVAVENGRLSDRTSHLTQFATIITMLIFSYIVVFRYPTPIGITSDKKKD